LKVRADDKPELGDFILAELNNRGVLIPFVGKVPTLAATWREFEINVPGRDKGLAVEAHGCSFEDACAFCRLLLSPLRLQRRFANDNEESFWFSIDGKEGSFSKTDSALVISFIDLGVGLTIAKAETQLNVGISGPHRGQDKVSGQ
jgi:hypothetical protein